jgi:hypothetical protein
VSNPVADVVRDIALLVWDRAEKNVRDRIAGDRKALVYITRADLEQAVIELRYEQIAVLLSQLDQLRAIGKLEEEAAHQRGIDRAPPPENIEIIEPDSDDEK